MKADDLQPTQADVEQARRVAAAAQAKVAWLEQQVQQTKNGR